MKKLFYFTFCALFAALVFTGPSYAFLLGEESHGAKIKVTDEADMTIRVLLQPRIDFGDLIENSAGTSYEREGDLYFRRVRLSAAGTLLKNLTYNLTLDADRWDQAGKTDSVDLHYAYLRYDYIDELNVEIGKHKLPYSRIALTSSSKQLIIERPVSVEAAKDHFGSYDQFMVMVDGKTNILETGEIKLYFAFADGITAGDIVATGPTRTANAADALVMGRIEFSPTGYIEGKKSDAHLGKGKHLTVGVNFAIQKSIEFVENIYSQDRELWGFDVSGHLKELTLQFEYNYLKAESNDPAVADVEPQGWYVQAGYFITRYDIEPVVRYESFDQDSNVGSAKEELTTLGLNWYPKGHTLKLGANLVHSEFEVNADGYLLNDDTANTIQVQGQYYF